MINSCLLHEINKIIQNQHHLSLLASFLILSLLVSIATASAVWASGQRGQTCWRFISISAARNMIIIFYNTLLVLFLSLSFTTSGISSSIPQFGQTSRSSRRVPQRLTSKLNIKKSKWIVHLYPNCTHQHFARHLDQHLTVLRESSRDHSLHQSTLIIHEYQHVLHGLAIQDIDEESLQALPCIKSYVRDSVKRLVSVPSWGIDRIDQENLPLDNKYETTYTGRNVDGRISPLF